MNTFTDSKNRTWQLEMNCDTVEQIKTDCGVNIIDLLDPESDVAREVTAFPPLVAKLLYAAISDQVKAAAVDDRDFRRAMNGKALHAAYDVLLEEIVLFCPTYRQKVASAVLEKNRDVQEAAADLALARLEDPDLKVQVMEALEANLRTEMKKALARINPNGNPDPGAIASSPAVGTLPVSSASLVPDLTPGASSAA